MKLQVNIRNSVAFLFFLVRVPFPDSQKTKENSLTSETGYPFRWYKDGKTIAQ